MYFFQNTKMLMTVTLYLLLGGCATDDFQPVPADAPDDLTFLSYSPGGDREPEPDPETDCKCYMRVNSLENVGTFTLGDY